MKLPLERLSERLIPFMAIVAGVAPTVYWRMFLLTFSLFTRA